MLIGEYAPNPTPSCCCIYPYLYATLTDCGLLTFVGLIITDTKFVSDGFLFNVFICNDCFYPGKGMLFEAEKFIGEVVLLADDKYAWLGLVYVGVLSIFCSKFILSFFTMNDPPRGLENFISSLKLPLVKKPFPALIVCENEYFP